MGSLCRSRNIECAFDPDRYTPTPVAASTAEAPVCCIDSRCRRQQFAVAAAAASFPVVDHAHLVIVAVPAPNKSIAQLPEVADIAASHDQAHRPDRFRSPRYTPVSRCREQRLLAGVARKCASRIVTDQVADRDIAAVPRIGRQIEVGRIKLQCAFFCGRQQRATGEHRPACRVAEPAANTGAVLSNVLICAAVAFFDVPASLTANSFAAATRRPPSGLKSLCPPRHHIQIWPMIAGAAGAPAPNLTCSRLRGMMMRGVPGAASARRHRQFRDRIVQGPHSGRCHCSEDVPPLPESSPSTTTRPLQRFALCPDNANSANRPLKNRSALRSTLPPITISIAAFGSRELRHVIGIFGRAVDVQYKRTTTAGIKRQHEVIPSIY